MGDRKTERAVERARNARGWLRKAAVLVVAGVASWMVWWGYQHLLWGNSIDYGSLPAATVFERVTGKPVPDGVSKLRASGRTGELGFHHWVWMSFDVTEKGLRSLVGSDTGETGVGARRLIDDNYHPRNRLSDEDMRAVGWGEVSRIRRPRAFSIGHSPGGSFVWAGVLIFDPDANRAYLKAGGS